MEPIYHVLLPDSYFDGDYDSFDVTNAKFILYSPSSGTEYPIDADEVIKLMGGPNVEFSTRAKAAIDKLLEPALQV
jgi:hypothetical protein